jgi:hypothetical protein
MATSDEHKQAALIVAARRLERIADECGAPGHICYMTKAEMRGAAKAALAALEAAFGSTGKWPI